MSSHRPIVRQTPPGVSLTYIRGRKAHQVRPIILSTASMAVLGVIAWVLICK
ncbi:hypothetical protein [Asticcacaulis solisilvae]|uniref:hypothetical protein n=1 Tax=Asticcacaulis solisilvae TaxID=1217274 RepID=UPI003FD75DF3